MSRLLSIRNGNPPVKCFCAARSSAALGPDVTNRSNVVSTSFNTWLRCERSVCSPIVNGPLRRSGVK